MKAQANLLGPVEESLSRDMLCSVSPQYMQLALLKLDVDTSNALDVGAIDIKRSCNEQWEIIFERD